MCMIMLLVFFHFCLIINVYCLSLSFLRFVCFLVIFFMFIFLGNFSSLYSLTAILMSIAFENNTPKFKTVYFIMKHFQNFNFKHFKKIIFVYVFFFSKRARVWKKWVGKRERVGLHIFKFLWWFIIYLFLSYSFNSFIHPFIVTHFFTHMNTYSQSRLYSVTSQIPQFI